MASARTRLSPCRRSVPRARRDEHRERLHPRRRRAGRHADRARQADRPQLRRASPPRGRARRRRPLQLLPGRRRLSWGWDESASVRVLRGRADRLGARNSHAHGEHDRAADRRHRAGAVLSTTIENQTEDHLSARRSVPEARATCVPRDSSRSSTARSSRPRRRPTGASRPTRRTTRSARSPSDRSRSSRRGSRRYQARPTDSGAELCLTLLRCVGMISRRDGEIATRPVCAGPRPTATPDGQCLGRHELEYALLPGADELEDAELLLRRARLSVRLPGDVATGPVRRPDHHRRRRRVLAPEGRRGR